jgi:hypothetical protein
VQGHRKMNRLGRNGRTNDSLPTEKLRVELCLFQQHNCRPVWYGYFSTAMYRNVSEIRGLIAKYPGRCCETKGTNPTLMTDYCPSKYADVVGYTYSNPTLMTDYCPSKYAYVVGYTYSNPTLMTDYCPSKYADVVGCTYSSGSYTAGSTSLTLFWRSVLVSMSRKVWSVAHLHIIGLAGSCSN